jgi:hypothetical protein
MPVKVAGTWLATSPVGIKSLTDVDTSALYTVGTRCKARDVATATAYGDAEFVYLKGVAGTARGQVVLIKDDYSTSLVAARDKGALAVALAATVANTWGWYQILGTGVVLCGTVAASAPCYIAAGNLVDDAVIAGDQIIGMRTKTTDDTSTCVVTMGTYPATADFDNA